MAEVRVVIYDSLIEAMSLPGGQVYRWTRQRSERTRTLARKKAPMRSGRLRASITSRYEKPAHGTIFYVSAETGYAKYVHEGTEGSFALFLRLSGKPGMASHGRWRPGMQHALPGGKWPAGTKRGVEGIDADPFLADALREVILAAD